MMASKTNRKGDSRVIRGASKSTSSNVSEVDDIISLCTLKAELSEYLQRTESSAYHEVYPGVEMNNYDFTAERQNVYSTTLVESIAHLIKGCIGGGILGIHEGFMYGGLWTSLGGTLVIGLLVAHSMMIVVQSAHKMYGRLRVSRLSYPDLAEVALATGPIKYCRRFSKGFRYTLEAFLFVEYHGTCCIFNIMIANTLKKVLEYISVTVANSEISIRIYILIITLPLLALCLIRSFKYLAAFSLLADIIIAICIFITLYYSISIASDITKRPAWKSVHGFFRFCGLCIYTIDGVGVTLPIENHMERPQYFNTVLQFAITVVISFVMIIGFFGYWAWGEECRTPITIHMSKTIGFIIIQTLLTAALGVIFTVHFWVPFRIVWHYIGRKHKRNRVFWDRLYRTLYVCSITLFSIAFPNMTRWMTFIGTFFMSIVVFIYPAIIETLVTWKEPRRGFIRWILLKNVFFILIGIILCIGTFTTY